MKQALKDKWVKALRSGKYKQGAGKLKDGNKYCCLGVLCSIEKQRGFSHFGRLDEILVNETSDQTLLDKFGLTQAQQRKLTTLNDGEDPIKGEKPNKDFNYIANYIESKIRCRK